MASVADDRMRALAKTERERGNAMLNRALAAEAERDRYRAALARIDRLQARWDAPLRHKSGDTGEAAWAAVGSEATKIACDALGDA